MFPGLSAASRSNAISICSSLYDNYLHHEFCDVGGVVAETDSLPVLDTAAGPFIPRAANTVEIEELGETVIAAQLPPGAPNALAVGKRCALQGFEFHWKPYAPIPEVTRPDGVRCSLRANEDFVPFIRSGPKHHNNAVAMVGVCADDGHWPVVEGIIQFRSDVVFSFFLCIQSSFLGHEFMLLSILHLVLSLLIRIMSPCSNIAMFDSVHMHVFFQQN